MPRYSDVEYEREYAVVLYEHRSEGAAGRCKLIVEIPVRDISGSAAPQKVQENSLDLDVGRHRYAGPLVRRSLTSAYLIDAQALEQPGARFPILGQKSIRVSRSKPGFSFYPFHNSLFVYATAHVLCSPLCLLHITR